MNFSNTTALGKLVRLPLRLVPRTAVVPVMSGPLRGARWIVGAATHGSWLGTYEAAKQQLIERALKPGSVFYDVGANAGFYSLLASKRGARAYAFEPLPENLRFLNEHVRLNAANVVVVEAAVGREAGEAKFAISESRAQGALSSEGTLLVKVVSLDGFIAAGHPAPDVIKMDIEGGEVEALRGMGETLARKPTIFLATHSERIHEECLAILEAAGYRTSLIEASELLAEPSAAGG